MVHECKNESGKLGLDLIIGLSIFMVSFIFIAQYIPSAFTVEKSETSLQPVAYRTAAILAEDPGYWTNGTANGTEWWNHTDESFRIGLKGVGEDVNVLSNKRVKELQKLYNATNNSFIQQGLGLTTPYKSYNYNISLQYFSSKSSNLEYSKVDGEPLLLIGKPVPEWTDVAKYERYIVFDNATNITNISSKPGTPSTEIYIYNVSPPVGTFVIVITSTSVDTPPKPRMKVWLDNQKIIDVKGKDETIRSFDITDEINQEEPDKVRIKIHNLRGYVIQSQAGDYVGGRIGAKLVVTVW